MKKTAGEHFSCHCHLYFFYQRRGFKCLSDAVTWTSNTRQQRWDFSSLSSFHFDIFLFLYISFSHYFTDDLPWNDGRAARQESQQHAMMSKVAPWRRLKQWKLKGQFALITKKAMYFRDNAMEMNVILFVVREASQKLHRANQEPVM